MLLSLLACQLLKPRHDVSPFKFCFEIQLPSLHNGLIPGVFMLTVLLCLFLAYMIKVMEAGVKIVAASVGKPIEVEVRRCRLTSG